MTYSMKHARMEGEFEAILNFAGRVLNSNYTAADFDAWLERLAAHPELIVYAEADGAIIGCSPSFLELNGNVTVGAVAVDECYRNNGIASAMMREVERQSVAVGSHLIALGSVEDAEEFYRKIGYTGQLLIQSEKHSVDKLLSMNTGYKIAFTNVYAEKINQLCLKLDTPDRELQRRYEAELDGCSTQMMFFKSV